MLFLEKLYVELDKEKRIPKCDITSPGYLFNTNVSRALMLPTLVYGPESDDDWAVTDSIFLRQAAIAQIITSLETYYQSVLRAIAKSIKTMEVDACALSRFLKKNKLLLEFTGALETQETLDFYLLELIPEFFPLQQKDRIKVAMRLIDLDPVGTCNNEWNRTFGNEETSTVNLRHSFVHEGINFTSPEGIDLHDMDFIIGRIKDAIVLVSNIELQISQKYKDKKIPKLYPTESKTLKKSEKEGEE